MKRLILLLIVLAGGLAAASFAVPSNAATVNGVAITQAQLGADLSAIAGSPDYQCYLNAQEAVGTDGASTLPPVDGAETHSTVTTQFAATYLDTEIGHQLVLALAARHHVVITPGDLTKARAGLAQEITSTLQEVAGSKYACGTTAHALSATQVLSTLPSSFVDENVQFDATIDGLAARLAPVGTSSVDLEGYYAAHKAVFDTACITVAQYSSESNAEAALSEVASGTPFAQVAAAASGGPEGCDILYGITSQLPPGTNLALNTVSNPIALNASTYLLIEMTSKKATPFTTARSAVESAVLNAGDDQARVAIDAAEVRAQVSVDKRYGTWVPRAAQVAPPVSPVRLDVLDPSANSAGTGAPRATTSSTGKTS